MNKLQQIQSKIHEIRGQHVMLDSYRAVPTSLMHTASRRMSIVFYCLFLIVSTFFFASCERYEDSTHVLMKGYFDESQRLSQVSTDSVARFSQKVNQFTSRVPAAKDDPLYPQIQKNINMVSLTITITVTDGRKDETVIHLNHTENTERTESTD